MIRYATRAVPWPEVAGATAVVGIGVAVLLAWPSMWRSLGLPVAALVAVAAWAMDEPAAAVVDATPRTLRWRTVARLVAVLPGATFWMAFSLHEGGLPVPHQAAGHAGVLLLIGSGGMLLGAAAATALRRCGRATPGQQTAVVVGLLVAAVGAFPRHLPLHPALFPERCVRDWYWARDFWTVLVIGALVALVVATSQVMRRADSMRPPEHRRVVGVRTGQGAKQTVPARQLLRGRVQPGGQATSRVSPARVLARSRRCARR